MNHITRSVAAFAFGGSAANSTAAASLAESIGLCNDLPTSAQVPKLSLRQRSSTPD